MDGFLPGIGLISTWRIFIIVPSEIDLYPPLDHRAHQPTGENMTEVPAEDQDAVEECVPCQVAVFGGNILFMCKNESGDEKFCSKLEERFGSGEMTVRDVAREVRQKLKPDMQEQLDNMMSAGEEMGLPMDEKLPTEDED
jgi:hypothetical protein